MPDCFTCKRRFHVLGIARHRAAHRDKKENCTIMYTNGDTYEHKYSDRVQASPKGHPMKDKIRKICG